MPRLKIREYSENDKSDIVHLLQRGHTESFTMERWDWLHHNPYMLGSHIVVAEYEGKIVGATALIKKRFSFNDESYVGGKNVDPIVDKSMRRKGIFTKLLSAIKEMATDVHFTYVFPINASLPGFVKCGYSSIGPIPMPYCQLRFIAVPLKEKIRYLKTGLRTVAKPSSSIIPARFEDLKDLKPIPPKNRYALLRDYNYIRWRYAESPLKSYDLLVSIKNGFIDNACVVLEDKKLLSIMDFIEYRSQINLLDYLVAIKKRYSKPSIIVWHNSLKDINKYFFGSAKGGQNFLVREGQTKMPSQFFDRKAWYVTKGEMESN